MIDRARNQGGANLTVAMKTTEQNYHVCVDSFSAADVIGRAKSKTEHNRSIALVRGTAGIKKIADYVDIRP
jgi:hypothetical protein